MAVRCDGTIVYLHKFRGKESERTKRGCNERVVTMYKTTKEQAICTALEQAKNGKSRARQRKTRGKWEEEVREEVKEQD